MAIRVLKYGGSSLANTDFIKSIAAQIKKDKAAGDEIVLVVSAMGSSTNELIDKAASISRHPDRRELDMLISTGERVSMSLMSMALNDIGVKAISFTGSQAGILTTNSHTGANIIEVKAFRVKEALEQGKVVVLAGFQGVCPETKEITTLGRGGTDTTAVAMADFLNADTCEMYKDVDGVFNADPKLYDKAKKMNQLSYNQLLSMCEAGAKVVHPKAVKLAKEKGIKLLVKKAHDENSAGSLISANSHASQQAFALNHSPCVYEFQWLNKNSESNDHIHSELQKHLLAWNFPDLQILDIYQDKDQQKFLLRGTDSNLDFFVRALADDSKIKLLRSDLSELSLSFSTPQNLQDTKFVGLYRYRKSALDHYFVIERNYTQNIIDKHLIQYLN